MLPEQGVAERTVRSRRRVDHAEHRHEMRRGHDHSTDTGSTPASGHRRTVHPGGAGVPVTAYPRDGHGRRPPPRTTEARLRQTTDPGQPPRGRPGDGRAAGSRRGRRSVRQPRPVHPGRDARGHAGPDGQPTAQPTAAPTAQPTPAPTATPPPADPLASTPRPRRPRQNRRRRPPDPDGDRPTRHRSPPRPRRRRPSRRRPRPRRVAPRLDEPVRVRRLPLPGPELRGLHRDVRPVDAQLRRRCGARGGDGLHLAPDQRRVRPRQRSSPGNASTTRMTGGHGSDPHGWRNALNFYGWGAGDAGRPARASTTTSRTRPSTAR